MMTQIETIEYWIKQHSKAVDKSNKLQDIVEQWGRERRQITKALKMEALLGENIAPVAFIITHIEALLELRAENKRLKHAIEHTIDCSDTELCNECLWLLEQALKDK